MARGDLGWCVGVKWRLESSKCRIDINMICNDRIYYIEYMFHVHEYCFNISIIWFSQSWLSLIVPVSLHPPQDDGHLKKNTLISWWFTVESTGVAEILWVDSILRIPGTKSHDAQAHQFGGGWFLIRCRLSQGHHTCRKLPLYISNTHGSWIFKSTQSICHVKLQWFETASKVALLQGYRRVKSGFQGCMIC